MPSPPKSIAELKIVGGYRPHRHAGRDDVVPQPTGELGDPPSHLTAPERRAWDELRAAAPWLASSDRMISELTCRMMAQSRAEDVGASYLNALQAALGRLGLSPADRRKVLVRPPEPAREESAFAKLAAKRRGP